MPNGTVDPNWLREREKFILQNGPDPQKHPVVQKRTWIILGVILVAVVVLYFVLRTTEAF